ncbi:MAG TPA: hypothetical protein VD998_04415 [Verrucomicrobiae bacterium]|nr:hypothetical protein [Verrucomicrobiae bacterium]
MKVDKDPRKNKKSPYLHSPAHVLADELAVKLSDKKHFGFYLRMATLYDHEYLRRIAGEVLEQKAKNPGALFAYLIKKNKESKSA